MEPQPQGEARPPRKPRNQFDQPWKQAIEKQLAQFIAFFAPKLYRLIDWDRKPVSLNTELRRWRRQSATPDRRADSLFEVYLENGDEHYVLIHLEVQTSEDEAFAERMFEYAYRAWDRHRKRLAAVAVLGDRSLDFRPDRFGWELSETEMVYRFPIIKLIDYRDRWQELEESRNIFAVVVMAFLKTQETSHDPQARFQWKWRLMRLLYERRYSREEIVTLYQLIDWMLDLPDEQDIIFEADLESLEAELNMPYLTSIERRALQRGIEQGIEQGIERGVERGRSEGRLEQLKTLLEHRFGPLPGWTLDRLGQSPPNLLDSWALRLLDARDLEDVFR